MKSLILGIATHIFSNYSLITKESTAGYAPVNDRWTKGAVHLFGLFASFVGSDGKPKPRLLSLEPMMSEKFEDHDNNNNPAEANEGPEGDGRFATPLRRSTKFGA